MVRWANFVKVSSTSDFEQSLAKRSEAMFFGNSLEKNADSDLTV